MFKATVCNERTKPPIKVHKAGLDEVSGASLAQQSNLQVGFGAKFGHRCIPNLERGHQRVQSW